MLKRPQFKNCYNRGRRFFTSLFVLFICPNGLEYPRVGITVSKKIGKAVLRNRVKRLLREFIRLNKELLPKGYDVVIIPKKQFSWSEFKLQDIEKDLTLFFKNLKTSHI